MKKKIHYSKNYFQNKCVSLTLKSHLSKNNLLLIFQLHTKRQLHIHYAVSFRIGHKNGTVLKNSPFSLCQFTMLLYLYTVRASWTEQHIQQKFVIHKQSKNDCPQQRQYGIVCQNSQNKVHKIVHQWRVRWLRFRLSISHFPFHVFSFKWC